VLGQCRSKTVIGRKVEQKARFQAGAQAKKTPQAQAHCGVSSKKMEYLW
jgi:hypothetical protein